MLTRRICGVSCDYFCQGDQKLLNNYKLYLQVFFAVRSQL